uniref:Uncharacterized protein n=1 Tax=Spongospora subterranea TaxID=70186 RepID=A0A0H5QK94_9EUKA|eukprot:CRZ01736.1 hypothetical protein [Spongospora subterranea]
MAESLFPTRWCNNFIRHLVEHHRPTPEESPPIHQIVNPEPIRSTEPVMITNIEFAKPMNFNNDEAHNGLIDDVIAAIGCLNHPKPIINRIRGWEQVAERLMMQPREHALSFAGLISELTAGDGDDLMDFGPAHWRKRLPQSLGASSAVSSCDLSLVIQSLRRLIKSVDVAPCSSWNISVDDSAEAVTLVACLALKYIVINARPHMAVDEMAQSVAPFHSYRYGKRKTMDDMERAMRQYQSEYEDRYQTVSARFRALKGALDTLRNDCAMYAHTQEYRAWAARIDELIHSLPRSITAPSNKIFELGKQFSFRYF